MQIDDEIYGATCAGLIRLLSNFSDQWDRILLVGHNPTLTDAAQVLAAPNLDDLPTCSLVVVKVVTAHWALLAEENTHLDRIVTRRELYEGTPLVAHDPPT